jgi:hypothetical protein
MTPRRRRERASREEIDRATAHAWGEAVGLLRHLAAGGWPPQLTVWGLVLQPGEVALAHLPVHHSRLYGHNLTAYSSAPLILGSPAFVIGGLVGSALADSRTRREVAAANAVVWRDQQHSTVVVTDRRLLVHAYGEWLSFWHSAVVVFHPDLHAWTTVLDFPDVPALRLHGPATPLLNTYLCWLLHGVEGLHHHPALDLLRAAAQQETHWPADGEYDTDQHGGQALGQVPAPVTAP